MARNQVQFQKGLGMAEFLARYGTEELCHDALVKMRWPDGFVFPKCAERRYSFLRAEEAFPVLDVSPTNVGSRRHGVPQIAHAFDEMVSRHAPSDGLQERHREP